MLCWPTTRIGAAALLLGGPVAMPSANPCVETPQDQTAAPDFDWHLPAGATVLLDTSEAFVVGGPRGARSGVQHVLGGVVRVRDLVVPAGTTLCAQGPNPLVIVASGDLLIDGQISVHGRHAQPVTLVDMPTVPEPGAQGTAGGGDGGTGSRLTDRSTWMGAPGRGAFDLAASGGQGGESGWHPDPTNFGIFRRAAGGGGGVFAEEVRRPDGCVDQSWIGLDAEDGFPGGTAVNSAVRPGELMPWGGRRGRGPFADGDAANDFWGELVLAEGTPQEAVLVGELPCPFAGAGGGAGGDATLTGSYPPPSLVPSAEDKGAGGGGGGGALLIFARGDVVLGPLARLTADGGNGAGGENVAFSNRIGGGSGGGSGGHVVVQSLGRIDLGALPPQTLAISALGGQGGAGAGDAGGANGEDGTSAVGDGKHVGVSGPGDMADNPWIPAVPIHCQLGLGVVRAAGGDGGPGVIQLHVRSLDAIVPPGGDLANLAAAIRPPPVGFDGSAFVGRLVPTSF